MSHRRKRNIRAKRPEPRDLAEAIAWSPRFQKMCRGLGSTIRLATRTGLAWSAALSFFSAFGPWTSDLPSRLPFVAVFVGSLVGFFFLLSRWP